jgi:hypothetical protein
MSKHLDWWVHGDRKRRILIAGQLVSVRDVGDGEEGLAGVCPEEDGVLAWVRAVGRDAEEVRVEQHLDNQRVGAMLMDVTRDLNTLESYATSLHADMMSDSQGLKRFKSYIRDVKLRNEINEAAAKAPRLEARVKYEKEQQQHARSMLEGLEKLLVLEANDLAPLPVVHVPASPPRKQNGPFERDGEALNIITSSQLVLPPETTTTSTLSKPSSKLPTHMKPGKTWKPMTIKDLGMKQKWTRKKKQEYLNKKINTALDCADKIMGELFNEFQMEEPKNREE